MKRPVLVLGALVAGSACAVWAHVSLAPSAQRAAAAAESETVRPAVTQVVYGVPHRETAASAVRPNAETRVNGAPARTEPPMHSDAMRVALDPATGQITPPEHSGAVLTIEQMQALARREAKGLVTLRNPDGSETLNHEGRFADYTIVRVGPDGRPVFVCVQGAGAAAQALHAATPVTPKVEDR
jgi:hypothetical protein